VEAEALPAPVGLDEIRAALPVLAARVEALEALHGVEAARLERDAILAEMSDVGFWNDQNAARRKLDAYQRASSTVDVLSGLRRALDTLTQSFAAPAPSVEATTRSYKLLLGELPRIEFTSWLSGPHDTCGAYLRITVKSRLAAARQWAVTLARMYLGWARRRQLSASVLGEEQSPDGRRFTAALAISGFGVYGLLQGEQGTHRLVQLVKVSGQETVQKFAASVNVLPELPDDELPAPPADLEVALKTVNRSGLLVPRLSAHVTLRHAPTETRLSLGSNLLPDDLAAEAARIVRTSIFLATMPGEARTAPPPGGLVRSYVRNTKEKGVHDHRTGRHTLRLKQVLEGDGLQDFLDAALKERSQNA
jgi:peptide chain release factor 2